MIKQFLTFMLTSIGILFAGILLSTIIGGVLASVVGYFLPTIITTINDILGVNVNAFTLGAAIGFVSAFFSR